MSRFIEHPEQHPLASTRSTIGTWRQWKERWTATEDADDRHNLLHRGFSAETGGPEERVERICFYLDVADGHDTSLNFRLPDEEGLGCQSYLKPRFLGEEMPWSEVRRRIAQKAFEVVANALFKNQAKDGSHPSWSWIAMCPELLDKVLWFFRVDDESRIGNFPGSGGENVVYARITHAFLIGLAEFVWTFRCRGEFKVEKDDEIQKQLRQRCPRLIEILWGIGELKMLLAKRFELDGACFAKLEELALRRKLYLPTENTNHRWSNEYRQPVSLGEAHFAGCWAAIVLTHRRIVAEEEKRFARLKELSERQQELEEERTALETPRA